MSQLTKHFKINYKIIVQVLIFVAGLYIIKVYDKPIFLWINPDTQSILSYFFMFLTTMMDGIIVLLIMSLFYNMRKKYFLPSVTALIVAGVLVHILKEYFAFHRPAHHFNINEMSLLGRNLHNYSFPSGHATAAMIFTLYLRGNSSHALIYFLIGFVGGLSRVLVGVHFPSDVWAGCWLGYFLGKSSIAMFKHNQILKKVNLNPYLFYLSIIIGFGSIIGYIFFNDTRYVQIDILMLPMVSICGLFLIIKLITVNVKP